MTPASESVALNAIEVLKEAEKMLAAFASDSNDGLFSLASIKAQSERCRDVADTLARRIESDFEIRGAEKDCPIYIASEHLVAEFRLLERLGNQAAGVAMAGDRTEGLGQALGVELTRFRRVIEGANK